MKEGDKVLSPCDFPWTVAAVQDDGQVRLANYWHDRMAWIRLGDTIPEPRPVRQCR